MDETINKNHKESIAEYNKQTKLQSSAFKEAGASEDYINKYLAKRNILKEQQFSLDKKSNDAAKKPLMMPNTSRKHGTLRLFRFNKNTLHRLTISIKNLKICSTR